VTTLLHDYMTAYTVMYSEFHNGMFQIDESECKSYLYIVVLSVCLKDMYNLS
jgi:hypothetical protein